MRVVFRTNQNRLILNYLSDDMADCRSIEKIETIYGCFYSRAGDLITEQLKQYSAHTRNELAMLKSFIREGDNIIDVGAHIGTFSIPFAIFNGGIGKVFAFEANPDNYQLLQKNILENNLETVVLPICTVISVKEQTHKMMFPKDANTGMYYFMPTQDCGYESLDSVNIDEWYDQNEIENPIHCLKIDTEGSELSVLRACQNILKKYKPLIYLELSDEHLRRFGNSVHDIEKILVSNGYHFFRNIGARNSDNDDFTLAHLRHLTEGGKFYDVLAIHPLSERYPKYFKHNFTYKLWRIRFFIVALAKHRFKHLLR